jgi:hypothetical protein
MKLCNVDHLGRISESVKFRQDHLLKAARHRHKTNAFYTFLCLYVNVIIYVRRGTVTAINSFAFWARPRNLTNNPAPVHRMMEKLY